MLQRVSFQFERVVVMEPTKSICFSPNRVLISLGMGVVRIATPTTMLHPMNVNCKTTFLLCLDQAKPVMESGCRL